MASKLTGAAARLEVLINAIEDDNFNDKTVKDVASIASTWAPVFTRLKELADNYEKAKPKKDKDAATKALVQHFRSSSTGGGTVELALADDESKPVDLKKFLEHVSSSVVATQEALDRRSLEYVRGLEPQIAPAHFAMPTVRAEMKVGFREITQQGVSLILFSRKEQKEAYGESTVSFEITAAPPPPGPVVAPPPRIFVDGSERERVLDEAVKLVGPEASKPTYDRGRGQALVLRRRQAGDEDRRFLVVWPADWLSVTDPETWPELKVFGLRERQSAFELDDVFETAGAGVVTLATAKKLLGDAETSDDLAVVRAAAKSAADAAIDLGDALYNVVLIVEEWLKTLRPPLPPPADA